MSSFADYFDKIYVINLASRRDRRLEVEEQLRRIGLSLNKGRVQLFVADCPTDAGGFPSKGARGCFQSHLEILREARRHRLNRILIFEDDVNFASDFAVRSKRILCSLSSRPWQMFYGGYYPSVTETREEWRDRAHIPDDDLYGITSVPVEQAVATTHFVGFQHPAISNAADFLETMLARPAGHPEGGPMEVDGAYCWFRRTGVTTLMASVPLAYQRSSRSDIRELRWFDRVSFLRYAVNRLRRVRDKVRDGKA